MLVALVLTAVVALDQGTKALIASSLPPGGALSRHPLGIRICHFRNSGSPARIARSPKLLFGLWIVLVCALPLLLTAAGALDRTATQFGLGVVLGGTLGNLIDRAARGAVIDFIDLGIWPVFNVADAAIVLGTLLVFWSAIA
jgi:signal peptidase II